MCGFSFGEAIFSGFPGGKSGLRCLGLIELKALIEDLPVMGEADMFISNQTHTVSTAIVIIK